jgi:uncharacterized protein YutE (UPF0331/DUF86 family)
VVDQELLSRKLSRLKSYVESLRRADDIDWEKYRADPRAKAFVERYLHLAIEEVFDVANHIVSFHGWREPEGYRDLLVVLSEDGVIPEGSLPTFQRMASFRNLLVRRYDRIDDDVVFGAFRNRLGDFGEFARMIKDWTASRAKERSQDG